MSAATPWTIHRSWVTVPWWAATAARTAASEVPWTMTDRVGPAVDPVAGATAAGATKTAARRNTTTAMRFRFARMNPHDRQPRRDLHGPIVSLALRGRTSSPPV